MTDFFASLGNYAEHLAPIYLATPEPERGTFYAEPRVAPHLRKLGIPAAIGKPKGPPRTVVVAGIHDVWAVRKAARHRVVLVEHGAGQGYGQARDPGWSGGERREDVALFVVPNEVAAERNRTHYPDTPNVIASPRVEHLRTIQREPQERPTVALSFHWPGTGKVPAAGWALPHYEAGLPAVVATLRERGYEVIGHGHPRARQHFARLWGSLGIEYVPSFDDVIRRAAVYVVDNSSSAFEAVACGLSVVWLSCPAYTEARRELWWPRWDQPGWWTGTEASRADTVADHVVASQVRGMRRGWGERATAEVYPVIEGAAKLVVEAIRGL